MYWLLIISLFVFLGFISLGSYYSARQFFKPSDKANQTQITPTSITAKENTTSNFKTYKNTRYGIEFDIPKNYTVTDGLDCSLLMLDQNRCLVSLVLKLDFRDSDFVPEATFWFLKGVNSVKIPGQVSHIYFETQKRVWRIDNPPEVFPLWGHTESGQEIIKAFNGGSHSNFAYYIIPDYEKDEVAIFAFPESFRLRCDLIENRQKQLDCDRFYKSVIDQYYNGEETPDNWLGRNYLNSIYSEAENIVRSFRKIVTK